MTTLKTIVSPPVAGPPFAMLLDLPAAEGSPVALQYIAVHTDPWPGSMTVWRGLSAGGFAPQATLEQPATVGKLLTTLLPGPLWVFDRTNSLQVQMTGGTLAGADDAGALAGTNVLAIRGADGKWEPCRVFKGAADRATDLSRLWTDQGAEGFGAASAQPVAPGAPVIVIDDAVVPVASGNDALGLAQELRVTASDRNYTDAAAVALSTTIQTNALLPYSPVSLKAKRQAGGIVFTWIRRTRIGGDAWSVMDVPLSETSEAYLVEVMNGSVVARSATVTATT